MKARQIITSQIKYIIENLNEFIKICLPWILITLVSSAYLNASLSKVIVYYLVEALAAALMVVNIHRLIILNDKNYYSFNLRFKFTLIYLLYAILISVICFVPAALVGVVLQLTNNIPIILGLICFAVFCFFFYFSFVLILPMVAVGEKVKFFQMWQLSKGFKLNIGFQVLIIFMVAWPIFILRTLFLLNNPFLYGLVTNVVSISMFILIPVCLSKTYLLWKENQTIKSV